MVGVDMEEAGMVVAIREAVEAVARLATLAEAMDICLETALRARNG